MGIGFGNAQLEVRQMAKVWVLDQFLGRDVSLSVGLFELESQRLLKMVKRRRHFQQFTCTGFWNHITRLSAIRLTLLRFKTELHTNIKS